MKKQTWLAACMAAACAFALVIGRSSETESGAVERVTLNATTLTLSPGATGKLTATVLPENADDKTVTWSSSDTEVATVGEDGTVTAVKAGEATITARAGGKTAVCEVTVKPILIAVESVTLNETTLTLMRGETGNLTATVLPENADDRTVMWSSSDTAVATVDENGTVAAVGIGTATIYAQAGNKQAACRVTVRLLDAEAEGFEINVNGTLTKYTGTDTDVKIPDGVREIGYSAFKGHTSLTGVTIPKGVTSIGLEAFRDCDKLASVTIPESVTSIRINAFWNCKSLDSVTYGGTFAQWCALGEISDLMEYAKCVTMGDGTDLKQATTLKIPDGVTSIGDFMFYKCTGLTEMTIPNGVTEIGNSAFEGCTSLTSVTIPDGVTKIGMDAFFSCENLTTINYTGTKEQWNAITKGSCWDIFTGGYTITYNYTE